MEEKLEDRDDKSRIDNASAQTCNLRKFPGEHRRVLRLKGPVDSEE